MDRHECDRMFVVVMEAESFVGASQKLGTLPPRLQASFTPEERSRREAAEQDHEVGFVDGSRTGLLWPWRHCSSAGRRFIMSEGGVQIGNPRLLAMWRGPTIPISHGRSRHRSGLQARRADMIQLASVDIDEPGLLGGCAKYGLDVDYDSIERLCAQHGLTFPA